MSGGPLGWPSLPPEPAPDPRPAELRPLSVGGVIDVAVRIMGRHVVALLVLATIIQLPALLIDAVAQQHVTDALLPVVTGLEGPEPTVREPTPAQWDAIVGAFGLVGASSIVGMLLGALAGVGAATAVLADYHGQPVRAAMLIRASIGRALPAMGAAFLSTLAILAVIAAGIAAAILLLILFPAADGGGLGVFLALVVGVATTVAAVTLLVRLALTSAVVAGERVGALGAIRRSWYLTGQHTWRTFAILLVVTLAVAIIGSMIVQLLAGVLTDMVAAPLGLGRISDVLIASIVSLVLSPIGGVVIAVIALDLRVRRDGWRLTVGATPNEDPRPGH
ncbi:MAG: hypothetical protein KF809_04335 [Chloroflexi bacterium]|nr:hypothetical protein [Chloroflexota bacterium]